MKILNISLSVRRSTHLLFIINYGCALMLVWLFLRNIYCYSDDPLSLLAQLLPEALLITLPASLLSPRYKYLHPVVLAAISIFYYVNIIYYRNFDDLIPLSSFGLASTVDSLVIDSALSSVGYRDIAFVFPTVLSVIAIRLLSRKTAPTIPSTRWRLSVVAITLLLFIVAHVRLFTSYLKTSEDKGYNIAEMSLYRRLDSYFALRSTLKNQIVSNGITTGLIVDAQWNYRSKRPLSRRDIEEILSLGSADIDPTLTNRQPKNLILIIVESLNTLAAEWQVNGCAAMPHLCALLADSDAVTFTSVCPQVGSGRSSDGQMMYISGIYPARKHPMAAIAPNGPYPSLARLYTAHGGSAVEIIAEKQSLWHHHLTSRAFGFQHLYHDMAHHRMEMADSTIFAESAKIIPTLRPPFFATVTSLAMHQPYTTLYNPPSWISSSEGLSDTGKIYLERCYRFDNALGRFIDSLKTADIWDETVVVIASDHEAYRPALGESLSDDRILFTILHSGHPALKTTEIVGQIDLFPTILDAVGLWNSTAWHGFGTNLLRSIPGFALRHDGTIAGDSISNTAPVASQRRAVALSDSWIHATNKTFILQSLDTSAK